MTVAMLCYDKCGEVLSSHPYLPVATEATYRSMWLPIAEEFGLHLLLLAQTGIPLDKSNIRVAIDETNKFIEVAQGRPGYESVVDRAIGLLQGLGLALEDENVGEVFIG